MRAATVSRSRWHGRCTSVTRRIATAAPSGSRRKHGRLSWLLFVSLLAGCGSDVRTVETPDLSYEVGPGWSPGETFRVADTDFGAESYGRARCANRWSPEGLLVTGRVPATQDVDMALRGLIRAGLLRQLFGDRTTAFGGHTGDAPPGGRSTRLLIAEANCIALDLSETAPLWLDVRGYPAHGGVAVIIVGGTIPQGVRQPVLDSIRVIP